MNNSQQYFNLTDWNSGLIKLNLFPFPLFLERGTRWWNGVIMASAQGWFYDGCQTEGLGQKWHCCRGTILVKPSRTINNIVQISCMWWYENYTYKINKNCFLISLFHTLLYI